VQVEFCDSGCRPKLGFGDQEPLGLLLDLFCKRHKVERHDVTFQVWEKEIQDEETWAQLRKKHDYDPDLSIDVLRKGKGS